jgi:hypothetical protein
MRPSGEPACWQALACRPLLAGPAPSGCLLAGPLLTSRTAARPASGRVVTPNPGWQPPQRPPTAPTPRTHTHGRAPTHCTGARRSLLGAAAALLALSGALSWYASVCGGGGAADACFNFAHAAGVLGIGACAHVGWDVLLAWRGVLPGARGVKGRRPFGACP